MANKKQNKILDKRKLKLTNNIAQLTNEIGKLEIDLEKMKKSFDKEKENKDAYKKAFDKSIQQLASKLDRKKVILQRKKSELTDLTVITKKVPSKITLLKILKVIFKVIWFPFKMLLKINFSLPLKVFLIIMGVAFIIFWLMVADFIKSWPF